MSLMTVTATLSTSNENTNKREREGRGDRDRQTETDRQIETDIQRDRQTDRHRQTDREVSFATRGLVADPTAAEASYWGGNLQKMTATLWFYYLSGTNPWQTTCC